MTIWRFKLAEEGRDAVGVPVKAFFAGRRFLAVYELDLGDPRVIHFESGREIAVIAPEDLIGRGPPDRAQAALNRLRGTLEHTDVEIWEIIDAAPVINNLPTVVGTMRRPDHAELPD